MQLTVACGQFTSTDDVAANLDEIRRLTHEAAAADAQLAVFPEAAMAGFGSDLTAVAQPFDGPFVREIRTLAAETGVAVVAGLFVPTDDGRVTNTLVATDGPTVARYDKIHLFDALGHRESDTVQAGAAPVVVQLAGATIGLATCFDVRFADLFTDLGRRGAQVVVVPASWGEGPGKADQWRLLTRARAADAQAWLVACDQAWTSPRGSAPLGVGCSQVVDPTGVVVAALGPSSGLVVTTIDLDRVAEVRAAIPVLAASPGAADH